MQALIKIGLSALIIFLISEISRRSIFWSGVLASLPLLSVLALIWIYKDGANTETITQFCHSVFWLVIPSLLLFLILPILLKNNVPFYFALFLACTATALGYWGLIRLMSVFGITL